jgi:hypothetical protein
MSYYSFENDMVYVFEDDTFCANKGHYYSTESKDIFCDSDTDFDDDEY